MEENKSAYDHLREKATDTNEAQDLNQITNAITQFGNALALGGGSARDLNQITNAIRQMSAEGKILQEDLSIMTTRLAVLVPVLKDEFGGTRAKDIRDYFDSFNVPASEQATKFLEIVLARLSENTDAQGPVERE